MKTPVAFKLNKLFLAVAVTASLLTSCKQKENVEEKETTTVDSITASPTQNTENNDSAFLGEAAMINREEIELGKLAQSKGFSKEVKDFGKMMVDGHSKSLDELTTLAEQKNIKLPDGISEKGKETSKELNAVSGKDFDKLYSTKMVDGHKETIAKFEAARDGAADADVKAWIVKTLPDLQMHLDHAVMVQKINK